MAYKVEHAVDLETDIVVSTTVHTGTAPDTATIIDTAIDAAVNAEQAGADNEIEAIVADKGYHSTKVVTLAADLGMRAYIPERASPKQRRWVDKDPKEKHAVYLARRRTKSNRGKQLCRLRSELTERSFAHVCDTGGARRTWLRGLASVAKRHLMMVAARNLSTIMRAIIGIGGPRSLQGLRALLQLAWTHFDRLISAWERLVMPLARYGAHSSTATGG
jgi:transposase